MLSFQVYLPCYQRVQDTKLSIQKYMFAHIKILAWLVNVLISIERYILFTFILVEFDIAKEKSTCYIP